MSRNFGICGEIIVECDTSAISGGGSIYSLPPIPTPLNDEGLISKTGDRIPHKGTLINQIDMPTGFSMVAVGDIAAFLNTNPVWTVNATDFNAAADGFAGIYSQWYDNINDRLWNFAVDTGVSPNRFYTGYITLETGAVTVVGNDTVTTDFSGGDVNQASQINVSRTAIDSGDFTLTGTIQQITIDSTNGVITQLGDQNQTTEGSPIGNYSTLDGLIQVNRFGFDAAQRTDYIELTRNRNTVRVPIINPLFADGTTGIIFVLAWGDKVKIMQFGSTTNSKILRTFLRTEFDDWITLVADFGGLT